LRVALLPFAVTAVVVCGELFVWSVDVAYVFTPLGAAYISPGQAVFRAALGYGCALKIIAAL